VGGGGQGVRHQDPKERGPFGKSTPHCMLGQRGTGDQGMAARAQSTSHGMPGGLPRHGGTHPKGGLGRGLGGHQTSRGVVPWRI